MIALFDSKFSKKLDKLKNPIVAKKLIQLIEKVKEAKSIKDIPNTTQLVGHPDLFRTRIGDYRVGLELTNAKTITFLDFDKRGDFYKNFP